MKKPYIIIIVVLAFITLIAVLYSLFVELNTSYIIFPDGTNIKYYDEYELISNNSLPKYSFSLVKNGKLLGKEKFTIDDDTITLGEYELDEDSIAYRGKKFSYIEYKISELNDDDYEYLNNILSSKNININAYDISYITKYEVDLNNDDVNDKIYVISNNYDVEIGELFSMIVIRSTSDIIIDYNTFDSEFSSYVPYLYFIKSDDYCNIIVKNIYSSLIGQDVKIIEVNQDLTDYSVIYEEAK